MTVTDPTPATADATTHEDGASAEAEASETQLVEDDVLVEEISIDGMCGVY